MSSPSASAPLPVLIFDGDCGFCARCERWFRARSRDTITTIASQQLTDADLQQFGITRSDVATASYWVTSDARALRGERSIAQALLHTRGWSRLAGGVISVPPMRWIAAGCYRWLTRNRHRMPGSTDACAIDRHEHS